MSAPHVESGRWPVLLSLPADDPERTAALAHVSACPACESDRLAGLGLLEDLALVPKANRPAPEALERAALPVRVALAAESAVRLRVKWVEVSAAVGAFGLVIGLAARSNGGSWGPALVLLGAAALFPWLSGSLGGVAMLALAAVSTSFAGSRAVASLTPSHLGGFGCAGMEALAAVLPLAALALMARRRGVVFGSLAYAGAAGAGALAGQAALLLTCPSHDLAHLLVIHSGTVLIAAMVGAGVPRLVALVAPASPAEE
jgi:hypothetical protein